MADRVTSEQRAGGLEVPRGGVSVYDKRAGHVRNVSAEEAERGVMAGTMESKAPLQIRRGKEVRTIDDPGKLAEAKAYGWSVTDDAGAYQARIETEEDTVAGQIQGTAEGVASGLTFGVSDVVLGGGKGTEARKRYQARNKAAGELADAGRLAGEVAPVLFSGGGALGLKGGAAAVRRGAAEGGVAGARRMLGGAAKIATRAPVALERGGLALERGVSRALGGGLKGRVAGQASRGMLEGGLSGVGQAVHESVLGDRDLTGEYLLASGGMSALMGAGMGGAFPLVGKAASMTAKLPVSATKRVLGAAQKMNPDGPILGRLAQTVASGKRAGPMVEQGRMLLSKKKNDKLQRVLHNQDEVIEEIGGGMRKAADEYTQAQRAAVAAFERDRSGGFGRLLDDAGDGAVSRMVASDADAILSRLDDHLQVAQNPDFKRHFNQMALGKAEASLRLMRDTAGVEKAGAKAYHGMVNSLRDVQEQLTKLRGRGREEDTIEMLVDVESALKSALKSDKYGGAAKAFREVGQADALFFETAKKTKGSAFGRLLDREKLSTNQDALEVVRSYGDFRAMDRVDAAREYMSADMKAMARRAQHSESTELRAAVSKMEQAQKRMLSKMDDAAENAQILHRQKEMNRTPLSGVLSAAGPSGAMITGGMLGGAPGALAGGLMAMAARPGSTIRTLSAIRHMVDSTGVSLDGILKRVTAGGKSGANAGAGRVGSLRKLARVKKAAKTGARLSRSAAIRTAAQAHQLRTQEQRKKSQRAAELANPDRLAEVLARDMFDVMDAAPDLGGAMSERVHAAAEFLADKLPPESVDPITGKVAIVDDVTRDRFDRYHEAVTDPVATLRKLETGHFTSEHSEAIKTVWPRLFEQMQEKVFEQLADAADRGEPLPMSAKVSLGVLFDLATDATMTGKFQAQKMAVLGQAPPPEQAQPGAPQPAEPGKGTRKTNFKTSRNHATTIGRIQRSDI